MPPGPTTTRRPRCARRRTGGRTERWRGYSGRSWPEAPPTLPWPPPPMDAAVRTSPTTPLELDASLRALRLAERFMSIPARPRANGTVMEDTPKVRGYKEEIAGLRAQLAAKAERRSEGRAVNAGSAGAGAGAGVGVGSSSSSREDAAREKEARKRQLAEEELRRSRAEVERLRSELAGAGTVWTGSGRRMHANARRQHPGPFHRTSPGGFGSSQDIFRGDTDDARREQRLRDVEKHVDNAIRRIVAAHGIKLPAALRQGWSSVRSGHSGDGGAWDVISRKLVGVNKSSEEDLIIR
mmetsp:Transcript_60642/g.179819  ORF Transcript_60642/g.179819 Transcript_60642/m.179819 type:complete len:296 (-) Transcript_60642:345-1232(-)